MASNSISPPPSLRQRLKVWLGYLDLIKINSFTLQISIMLSFLVLAIIFALSAGRYPISFDHVVKILMANVFDIVPDWKIVEQRVVELVRLPRILTAGLCGAALAISGAALQGMFRNPLVGPQIIGVSSGSAFGGVLAILFLLPSYFISIFAFIFGVTALLFTMGIARAGGGKNILSLVLGGIVTSAFFASLVSLVKYAADP